MNLRLTIRIANLALLVLLGYVIAGIVLRKPAPPQSIPGSAAQRPTAKRDIPPITQEDCSLIVGRNVFGFGKAAGSPAEPDQGRLKSLARTKLQLRLLGTVAGDAAVARAVIEDLTSKVQDLYRIGDVVQGARINRIERNRVILLREGRPEVLELCLAASASPKDTSREAKRVPTQPDLGDAVKVISPTEFAVNKRALLARLGGMEALLKTAKLTPYVVDGKTEGLRITGIENVSMAGFVGLHEGDIIQAVNGQSLTSLQKAFQVFRKARTQRALDVRLLREDERKRLSFRLE